MKMKKSGIFIFALSITVLIYSVSYCQDAKNTNSCLNCHAELEDDLLQPALLIEDDIHQAAGLSCAGCHGGDASSDDPDIAMSPQSGFVGAPDELKIPQFCGKCHSDPAFQRNFNPSLPTDQLLKYRTSHHGQLNKKGDRKAAQCVSCHGVHNIKKANDPRSKVYFNNVPSTCAICHADKEYMKTYDIPTDQLELYRESSHGIALLERNDSGAPACNDCHGNHAAMPPGVSAIGRVCYQCHPAEGELFLASFHSEIFDMLEEAECVFCHENHKVIHPEDEWIAVGNEESLCIKCHSQGDKGYDSASLMNKSIGELRSKYEESHGFIEMAEAKGVEVSDEKFDLIAVRNSLVNIRKLVHTFDADTMHSLSLEAMKDADKLHQAGVAALNEVKHRRTGFYIFSLITLILLTALVLKIKSMD